MHCSLQLLLADAADMWNRANKDCRVWRFAEDLEVYRQRAIMEHCMQHGRDAPRMDQYARPQLSPSGHTALSPAFQSTVTFQELSLHSHALHGMSLSLHISRPKT